MKNSKLMKVLFTLVVSILVLGFTNNVDALSNNINLISSETFFSGSSMFHMKKVSGDSDAYAFCLDSNLYFESGLGYNASNSIFTNQRAKIERVIFNAFLRGLNANGTNSNAYGLTNSEFYEVTQMAVWYAAHGENKGGLTSTSHKNWLGAKKDRLDAYNYLLVNEPSILNYSLSINAQDNNMKKDGNYLVSGLYTINSDANLKFTVSVNSTDNNACVLYNDTCSQSQVISGGQSFKLRTDLVNGNVSVSANVKSERYVSGYDFALYSPNGKTSAGKTAQNAAVFKPKYNVLSDTVTASGSNSTNGIIEVQKLNNISHKVAGATIGIYTSDGKEIKKITSTAEGQANEQISLAAGKYYIKEISAPKGYIINNKKVEFSIDNNGNLLDKSGEVLSLQTLSILDMHYILVSKTDATGQKELPGAKIELYDGKKLVEKWESTDSAHQINNLAFNKIYELKETVAPEGYEKLETSIYFIVNEDATVTTCKLEDAKNKNICTAMSKEEILKIKNEPIKTNGVYISKVDITNEKEQPGATLRILDMNGNPVYQDGKILEWVSSDKPHYIEMLEPGKYQLVETVVPEGYAAVTNVVEFEVTNSKEIKTVVFENDVTKVLISKKDFTTGEEVEGAHLQILDEKGNLVYQNGKALEWVSGKEPKYIEKLPIGKYILVETIYPEGYEEGMIVDGMVTSRYAFEITNADVVKIDVYNKTMEVPNTGIDVTGTYVMGSMIILAGLGTIVISRKKQVNY